MYCVIMTGDQTEEQRSIKILVLEWTVKMSLQTSVSWLSLRPTKIPVWKRCIRVCIVEDWIVTNKKGSVWRQICGNQNKPNYRLWQPQQFDDWVWATKTINSDEVVMATGKVTQQRTVGKRHKRRIAKLAPDLMKFTLKDGECYTKRKKQPAFSGPRERWDFIQPHKTNW
jgi:hypothetical protein